MRCSTLYARLALCLVATLSVACLPRPPLTCPERGGAPWSEITTPHLVLRTDVEPASARRVVTALEGLYEALAHVMPRPRGAPAVKLDVVVFDRREDYDALFGPERRQAGFFTQKLDADFEPRPILVFYDDPRVGIETVFLHELAHRFLRERFARIPPWLDEGLAQYYETLRFASGHLVIGERRSAAYVDFAALPFRDHVAYEGAHDLRVPAPAPVATAPSLGELLGARERDLHARARRARFYAAAWRLSHLLMSREEARFSSFLHELERGANARAAFTRTFGDEAARIEPAYHDYLTEVHLPTRSVAFRPPPEAPLEHRLMRDAGVHLLWARLRPRGRRSEAAALGDLDEAIAREPGSAEARYVRARFYLAEGRDEDAARELDAALADRPEDPRYLYARLVVGVPSAAPGTPSTGALLERLSQVGTSATQLDLVAGEYGVNRGRIHEGLLFAERALRADPMCWWCEKTRSRILFAERKYTEAVVAADHAIVLAPDGETARGLRSEREFVARLRDADRPLPSAAR